MWQQPWFRHTIHISLGLDRLFQNVARGAEEFRNRFLFESRNLRRRMNACAEKNLVGIDISDARDQFLVKQNRFHCATMFGKDLSELRATDVERVRAEAAF